MKRFVILSILIGALTALTFGPALAAGSVALTMSGDPNGYYELTYSITSDASGNVSSPTYSVGTGLSTKTWSGRIENVYIKPGTGITNGTLKLLDASDATIDYLYNIGAGIAATASVLETPLSTTNSFPQRLNKKVFKPLGTGMGNEAVTVMKVFMNNHDR